MKKIFLLILCMVFLIGNASAFEFDNTLTYSNNDLKVDFTNTFGLGKYYGSAELKSHNSVNQILKFGRGNQTVMYYDFKEWNENYINGLGEVVFTNESNGEIIERDYWFVYWGDKERDVWEKKNCSLDISISEECEMTIIGTETYGAWLPYNSKDIPNKNIRIGLKTYVKKGDNLDAEWTIIGKKVSKHAGWEEAWNTNIMAYWKLDDDYTDATGNGLTLTPLGSPVFAAGIINNGSDLEKSAGDQALTRATGSLYPTLPFMLNIWAKPESLVGTTLLMNKFADIGGRARYTFRVTSAGLGEVTVRNAGNSARTTTTTSSVATGEWVMFSAVANGTDLRIYFNGTQEGTPQVLTALWEDGEQPFYIGAKGFATPLTEGLFDGVLDEPFVSNRLWTPAEVMDLYNAQKDGLESGSYTDVFLSDLPIVTLTNPPNLTTITETNIIEFAGTVSDDVNLVNVSLYIGGTLNQTNSSGFNATQYNFTVTLAEGTYDWYYDAWDNESQQTLGTGMRFTINTVPVINVFSPTNTTFTTSTISFDATASETIGRWIVNYNGTNHTLTNINTSLEVEDGFHHLLLYANNSVTGLFGLNDTIYFSVDATPPNYINNQTNTTKAGERINFSIFYDDGIALEPNGQYIFSINQTGTWVNDSEVNFTATGEWANVTKTLNSTIGIVIGFQWFGSDNAGNTNNTPIYQLITTDEVDPIVTENNPIDIANISSNSVEFSITCSDNYNLDYCSLYLNHTSWHSNQTNSSPVNASQTNFTVSLPNGKYIWSGWANDSSGNSAFGTNRTFSIDATAPTLNVTSPHGLINYHKTGDNLTLRWNVSDSNIDVCRYNYNGTNVTLTCGDNTTVIQNVNNVSNVELTFYSNDTFGNSNNSIVTWDYNVWENDRGLNNETTEGATELYYVDFVIQTGSLSTVKLWYNGNDTNSGFSVISGRNYNATIDDFNVPLVDSNKVVSLFWQIDFGSVQVNTSTSTQHINALTLDDCSTNTRIIYNYSIIDEELQTNLTNTTVKVNVDLFSLDRTSEILNFSKSYTANPVLVCLNKNILESTNFSLDSIVKYEAVDYSIEYYNIVNFIVSNSSIPQLINLYDLALTDATEFKISFKGEDFVFVENALIFIDRQYIAENNSFKTVELPKTDANGQTIGHFVRNDVVYNIRVIKDNEVLGSFDNIIAFCTDFTIGDCQIVLEATPGDQDTFSYDDQLGVIFQTVPTYNNNTNTISFSFSTVDGIPRTVFMSVERKDIFGNRTLCNNTLTSASGTLSCVIDPSISDTVLETLIYVDNQLAVLSNVKLEDSNYGNLGYVLWFFLTFIFIWLFGNSKTEVLIGLFVSFTGAITLGITKGDIVGIGSAGIWVLVIIILGIWKLNKDNPQ